MNEALTLIFSDRNGFPDNIFSANILKADQTGSFQIRIDWKQFHDSTKIGNEKIAASPAETNRAQSIGDQFLYFSVRPPSEVLFVNILRDGIGFVHPIFDFGFGVLKRFFDFKEVAE